LPFVLIKGCQSNNKCEKTKAINDSTIMVDSFLLVDAASNNLNSDSLKFKIATNRQKIIDCDNDTCYNWDSYRGYQIPKLTIAAYCSINDNDSTFKTILFLLIDLAIIVQFIGLIFIFIKRLQKTKTKFILSLVGLCSCLFSILLSILRHDLVKINYGLWLFFILLLICFIADIKNYKDKIKIQ
jgi:hypothetical protein